jgi:uncharacterized protein
MRAEALAHALAQAPARTHPHEPAIDCVDLAALDRFLQSDRSPPNSMMLSELDGFLTGLAVGPEHVLPSEWLPLVWGGEAPASDDAPAIVGTLVARYDEIRREIAEGAIAPVFYTDRDGEMITADWAEGFLQAIKLRIDAWKPLFTSRSDRFLVPILWPCRDDDGQPLLGLAPTADDRMIEAAAEFIPRCVMAIAAYWRRKVPSASRGERHHAAGKIGRNDPCPCGSGNKFKRCCGRAP